MDANSEIVYEESIVLINDLKELNRLDQSFNRLLTSKRIDDKTLFYLNLIADEMLTNIISYGYEDGLEHSIQLTIIIKPAEWSLKIIDDGKPFNPLDKADPDLNLPIEEREIGGLGIHFANQIMDKITYTRSDGCNIVEMKKIHTFGDEV